MRSRALNTPSRLGVRGVFCEVAFPLACPLPSTPSASGFPPSPGSLGAPWPSPAFPPSCPFRFAIAPRSDFFRRCSGASSVLQDSQTPCSVHRWLASLRLSIAALSAIRRGRSQDLPVLAQSASTHDQGLRPRQARSTSPLRCPRCCLRLREESRRLGIQIRFRGSIPALRVPLSTLRARPHGRVHRTRGHRGWLALQCATSSFATLCRFIPALLPERVTRRRSDRRFIGSRDAATDTADVSYPSWDG